jgi:large subunit ribosomal protein L6
MSKIGKLPIKLPEGVDIKLDGQTVEVVGPKGNLIWRIPQEITIEKKEELVLVRRKSDDKQAKALYGMSRAKLANMVWGVAYGWVKRLELAGTGYRAEVKGDTLIMTVGYSHPIEIKAPQGIGFKVEKVIITIEGADRELVGQVAAKIRSIRPPEPYKGKGVKYEGELIKRKAGKAAKAEGAPA